VLLYIGIQVFQEGNSAFFSMGITDYRYTWYFRRESQRFSVWVLLYIGIQGVSGRKVNILGGSIGQCQRVKLM